MIRNHNCFAFLLFLCCAWAFGATAPRCVAGEDAPYQPGDKIEYRRTSSSDWEPGEVLKILSGGEQVLIREKPNQFFKDGFERAYSLADVRRRTASPEPKPGTPKPKVNPAAPIVTTGKPLTQREVLDYLRTRLGDQPFQHPEHEKIKKELAELIKRRGVDFRYETISEFGNELSKFGATSDITFPIHANFGPPAKRTTLFGTWSMDIIGATTTFVRDNTLYRKMEGFAKGGTLVINPDRTYAWKAYASDQPAKELRGTWREATAEEMKHEGGEGLVLLAAKSGWDWLVTRDRGAPKGDWIRVTEFTSRQVTEYGSPKR
jgi:hypothetical protein